MSSFPMADIAADLFQHLREQESQLGQYIVLGRAIHRAGIMALVTEALPTQLLEAYTTAGDNQAEFVQQAVVLLNAEREKLQALPQGQGG
ncbi:MAG: hypothetical protein KDE51_24295 [Anaerolineales bacterium]|nr:hypothetical protein [Anaerolineales bacterium]